MNGKLTIIHGPMFSSKTSYLLGKLSSYTAIENKKVVYICSSIDTRSTYTFSSHNKMLIDNINFIDSMKIKLFNKDIIDQLMKYDIIGVDEGQFFGEDIFELLSLVEEHNKTVIISGLLINFSRSKFGYLNDLIPFADEVIHLKGYCHNCAKKGHVVEALFTKLLDLNRFG